MPPQAAQDDWGDTPAAHDRFAWGDENEQPKAAPATTSTQTGAAPKTGFAADLENELVHSPFKDVTASDLIPGTGIYSDFKAGNYKGIAKRIGRTALALAPALLTRGDAGEIPESAINSPSRSLPGEITPERIFGPRPTPAKPIPSREGLMLKGDVAPQTQSTPIRPINVRAPGEIAPEFPRAPRASSAGAPPIPQRSGLMLPGKVEAPSARIAAPSAPVEQPIARPGYYPPRASQFNTQEIGGPEDVAETRQIQDQVRSQADQETDALRKRGNEEGFSRNTRPRIAKADMTKNFRESQGLPTEEKPVKLTSTPKSRIAKPSAKSSGNGVPALGSGTGTDDLTDLLEESVRQAKARKAK